MVKTKSVLKPDSFLFLVLSMIIIAASLYLPEHVTMMAKRAWFYYAGDETVLNMTGTSGGTAVSASASASVAAAAAAAVVVLEGLSSQGTATTTTTTTTTTITITGAAVTAAAAAAAAVAEKVGLKGDKVLDMLGEL